MSKYKLALIGYPLEHSLSPILYKAAFKDIEDIEIQFHHMQDNLFVIMEKGKNEKKARKTIKLAKNTQNEVFIKQFWDRPFTDTRDSIWKLG